MGAPKGNTNALKHGLYAKRYSPEETADLRKMSPEDFRHEVYMMRVVVKNIFQIHSDLFKKVEGGPKAKRPANMEALARITNSLAQAVTTLNTTARTHALFSGTDPSVNDPLSEALDHLPIFLDDKYLLEMKGEVEERREILVENAEEKGFSTK